MNKYRLLYSLVLLALTSGQVTAQSLLEKGEYLSQAGDCAACHTAPGGKPFAGGLKMSTPIGAIYSSNITPDKETGIGQYSYDEFVTAVRKGVAKDGHHLYPAMPYTSFSKISDQDMQALYAWFMQGVPAVRQINRESDIPWPLNMRWPLAVWDWAFHDDTPFQPDTTQSEEWNRGAYLVQGLGHCGTCHTPRGIGFQEKALDQRGGDYLTGGSLEGWHAANLTGNMKEGLGRWSQQDIVQFLKTGWNAHSAAFGSMTDVIADSTQYLSNEDLTAMAVYLKSLPSSDPQATAPQNEPRTQAGLVSGELNQPGAQLYMDNCAACHRTDGKGYANAFPPVAHNPAILSDDPSSLISIILRGSKAAVTQESVTGLTMPDFGWRLNDQQVAELSSFVRNSWGNQAPTVSAKQVKEIRKDLPATGGQSESAKPGQ